MPSKRDILEGLTRNDLYVHVDHCDLTVSDRRVKANPVDALASSRECRLADALPLLSRNRLKACCRAFRLDDCRVPKIDLAARLTAPGTKLKRASDKVRQLMSLHAALHRTTEASVAR